MRYLITDNKNNSIQKYSAVEIGKYLHVFQTLILNKCQ